MKETKVVNIKASQKYDIYIGRPYRFGNPFTVGKDGNREEVIEKYKQYFQAMLTVPDFKEELLKLKGKTLGCFCKPAACHGDVICDYLNKLED